MHRWLRVAAMAAAVVAVLALALLVRTLSTAGLFAAVTPGFDGSCQMVAGLSGGNDIAVDRPSGLAFISVSGRRPSDRDGIYLVRLADPEQAPTRLSGTPEDFHPRGISLYRGADGSLVLMAVARSSSGLTSIDIFDVNAAADAGAGPGLSLAERGSVRSSLLSHANGVVAVGADRFYATNGALPRTSFGGILRAYLHLAAGTIVYFDGQVPHLVADRLRGASGIAVSHDGSELYVAEMMGRQIQTYDIEPVLGLLEPKSQYSLPAGLDNIDVDANGNLWVAGHPKLFAYADYAENPAQPSPSEVFRVATLNGEPSSFTAIYTEAGGRIGAASAAAYAGGHLLIGSHP